MLELQDSEECFKAFKEVLDGQRRSCTTCQCRRQSISRLRRLSITLADGSIEEIEVVGGTKSMEIGHALSMVSRGSVPDYLSSLGKGDALPDWIRHASTSDIATLANNTQVLFRRSSSQTDLKRLARTSPRTSQNASRSSSPLVTPASTPNVERHPIFRVDGAHAPSSPIDMETVGARTTGHSKSDSVPSSNGLERPIFMIEDIIRPSSLPRSPGEFGELMWPRRIPDNIDEVREDEESDDSDENVDSDLEDVSCEQCSHVCLTGLHCCGDLAATMMRIFVSMRELRTLVCVSCCYHNMRVAGESSRCD